MFLTLGTIAHFLRFSRSTEFERVTLLVLLHDYLHDIDVSLDELHLGIFTDAITKALICELVQQN